jgi:hypothetical protein
MEAALEAFVVNPHILSGARRLTGGGGDRAIPHGSAGGAAGRRADTRPSGVLKMIGKGDADGLAIPVQHESGPAEINGDVRLRIVV